jgi:hypothetical protein
MNASLREKNFFYKHGIDREELLHRLREVKQDFSQSRDGHENDAGFLNQFTPFEDDFEFSKQAKGIKIYV